MNIDIIGAGIGGLSLALALEQKGFKVKLYEQAEELRPVGAGIILANNAMQVYEKLGLREVIEGSGNHISSMNITKADLSPISAIDLSHFENKYGVKNIAIHRGALQQILVDSLENTEIKLNHRLQKLEKNQNGYALTFQNEPVIQSSVVIGADGIHSKVREQIFPNNSIRDAKQVCWRGVTDFHLPAQYRHELN